MENQNSSVEERRTETWHNEWRICSWNIDDALLAYNVTGHKSRMEKVTLSISELDLLFVMISIVCKCHSAKATLS